MRSGIGSALLAAAVLSTAARAAVVEEFKAEDWDGLAFTSDETGKFTHCSVYASYRNGSTLYISYEAADTWFLSVANDSWKLSEGGSFSIKLKIDRRGQIEGMGTALGPTQIGLPVEPDHPFVGQLRRGNELVISFQNEDYAFELSNSNRAMNAAQDCVRRHVALGTHTPIVSGEPEEQPQESRQAQKAPVEQETTTADNGGSSSSDADKPAQPSGEQQVFGPWTVAATEDSAKNFVNCTAYDVQGDDQLILSYFSDKVWTFGLYRAGWKLDTNQSYYIWYNIDGPADAHGVTKRPVDAAEPTRIFFEVSDVEDIIDRIEKGSTLNIQFRGVTGPAETYSYSLDQAPAAFEATRKCVADHSATDDAALHTEAAGYTTALLIRSGYPNHIIVNGDDVPEAFRSHRAMWKLADLVGVTDMVSGSVDEIKSNVFSSDTKDCAGESSAAVDDASGDHEHLHTICKKSDGSTITVHYLVIPRDAGGSYMLSFIDTGDGSSVGPVADKVYSTIVPM